MRWFLRFVFDRGLKTADRTPEARLVETEKRSVGFLQQVNIYGSPFPCCNSSLLLQGASLFPVIARADPTIALNPTVSLAFSCMKEIFTVPSASSALP
jgi:hypothetical protein